MWHEGELWEVVAIEASRELGTTCALLPVEQEASVRTRASGFLDRLRSFERDRVAWNLPDPRQS